MPSLRYLFQIAFLASLLHTVPLTAAPADYLWVEGEDAVKTDAKPHPWYSDSVNKKALSGGKWLSNFGDRGCTAEYDVTIPSDGDWTLWVRTNPVAAGVSYRVGTGPWKAIDCGKATDTVNIASDGKPDLRFVAWVKADKLPLKAGKVRLAFQFDGKASHHGGLDCFLLTTRPFLPAGKTKPGTRGPTDAEAGWWAFSPGLDELGKDALLDLRSLNEKQAGEHGWVRAQGDGFVTGDGKPVRFWAVNGTPAASEEEADYLAARLAKCGVNLVRLHGAAFDRSGNDPKAMNKDYLRKLFYQVKTLKDQGVYVHLSTYFPLWLQLKASDGVEGGPVGKNPFGLLMFEPALQESYREWARQVLTTKNPYTGKTLAEDPAVAFWEIQNEDSFLFWTFSKASLGAGPWSRLEKLFAAWLEKKYGSVEKALAAWPAEKLPGDDPRAKRVSLYDTAWHMTRDARKISSPDKKKRVEDQVRFLAELQHDFYAKTAKFLKEELKFRGVVTASNWTTADNSLLGGIERWTYTAADCIDKHGYFGGDHKDSGDGSAGFSVRAGHTYTDKAAVTDPLSLPITYVRTVGRPHIYTEIAWNKPNRFMAEGPLLTSALASTQGIDAYFWFSTHSGNWENNPGAKWPVMMPSTLGQFPAAALQFRRGDLTPGEVALRQVVTPAQRWKLEGSGVIEGQNVDFRIGEAPKASDPGNLSAFDPLSYFTGKVERVYTDVSGAPEKAKPIARDLSKHIDREGKKLRSLTGEVSWDWGNGLFRVDTPRSQAVTGFLGKAGAMKFGDVTIASKNEFGTVHVISLDGEPLSRSRKILVQAFAEEKFLGWKAERGKIVDLGQVPINVRRIDARVTFAAGGVGAIALDEQGYRRGPAKVEGNTVELPKDAIYTLVTR